MSKLARAAILAFLLVMIVPGAVWAQEGEGNGCAALPSYAEVTEALATIQAEDNGGLGLHMWATLVDRDGTVCLVTRSGAPGEQWPGSRVISAQKAYTANAFSVPTLALSTANLYNAVQPGSSLYGLQFSNPVDTARAYAGPTSAWGTEDDPMVGERIGGVNVFGGGLALFDAGGQLLGALGLSGDTSCADHIIAWKLRAALNLDYVPAGVSAAGNDNIVFDREDVYGHPACGLGESDIAPTLPSTRTLGDQGDDAASLETVVEFDAAANELPEGIVIDDENNIYVSLARTAEIRKITPAGESTSFATLPSPGDGNTTGLALDASGKLYAARGGSEDEANGVYVVSADGTEVERFFASEAGTFPNALVFDATGDLFVTNSFGGLIWRVDPEGNAEVWVEDDLLASETFGANGLALDAGGEHFYVANTGGGLIARVPVEEDGSAGTVEVFVEDERLMGADGLTFGPDGVLYVAVNGQDSIVAISPDGEVTVLAEGGILQNPASLELGSGDEAGNLYITNFAVRRSAGDALPGLVRLAVE